VDTEVLNTLREILALLIVFGLVAKL